MGAYKHIGRLRSAKLISRDLADFYMFVSQVDNTVSTKPESHLLISCIQGVERTTEGGSAPARRTEGVRAREVVSPCRRHARETS